MFICFCDHALGENSRTGIVSKPWTFSRLLIDFLRLIFGTVISTSVNKVSVQFSCSVVSNSLQPHESQLSRPPCLSPTPGVHPNSCASSQWCYPAISSSVIPFSPCPQSLPASGSSNESTLRMRWPKYWSLSLSISPSNEHPGLISFRMD